MRKLAIIIPLLTLLAVSTWWAYSVWVSVEAPPMPASGYFAMTLGIVFSLVVGFGLMALVFYSHRKGYDDAAHGDKAADQ